MTDETFMAQMHGRLPDGTWLRGVEVFRRMYAAVSFDPLVFLSLSVLKHAMRTGKVKGGEKLPR